MKCIKCWEWEKSVRDICHEIETKKKHTKWTVLRLLYHLIETQKKEKKCER